jgi:hypothetical protein
LALAGRHASFEYIRIALHDLVAVLGRTPVPIARLRQVARDTRPLAYMQPMLHSAKI